MSTELLVDIGVDQLAERARRRRMFMRIAVPIAGVASIARVILGISLYAYQTDRA